MNKKAIARENAITDAAGAIQNLTYREYKQEIFNISQ